MVNGMSKREMKECTDPSTDTAIAIGHLLKRSEFEGKFEALEGYTVSPSAVHGQGWTCEVSLKQKDARA